MKMSIGERIKSLRGNENQSTFGNRFGRSRNTIMRYETGKNAPDADFAADLCREYNVEPTWLLLGQGPMRKGEETTGKISSSLLDCELLQAAIEAVEEVLKKTNRSMAPDKKAKLILASYDFFNDSEKHELKKKFPEIIEGKKQAVIAETSAKTAQVQEEKSEVKKDKDFIIRQQIADIKDALMIMGIKTGIFKEKKETEVNANTPIEQQVSGIRDTLNAMCIKMGLLEERRKEQIPINFPDRRHSEHSR